MEKLTSSSSSSLLMNSLHDHLKDSIEYHHQLDLHDIVAKRVAVLKADADFNTRLNASNYVDFQDEVTKIQGEKNNTGYAFLTISPKPDTTLSELQLAIDKLLSKYYSWAIYTFELRSAPDVGLHCHLLGRILPSKVNTNYSRWRQIFVPNLCGTVKHARCDFISQQDLEKTMSYVLKTKVAKSKQASHEATQRWRAAKQIPSHAIYGDIPTCLSPSTPTLLPYVPLVEEFSDSEDESTYEDYHPLPTIPLN